MNKLLLILLIVTGQVGLCQDKVIARQGQVSFFSYTSVENIEAVNNQVLSIIDLSKGDIAVSMLMRAFIFKKALMEEHFNESYIESDRYPKLQFEGRINDFDRQDLDTSKKIVNGTLTLHGVSQNIELMTSIAQNEGNYVLTGQFEVGVSDYNINVPPLLRPNIAKTIKIEFIFEYEPYENE